MENPIEGKTTVVYRLHGDNLLILPNMSRRLHIGAHPLTVSVKLPGLISPGLCGKINTGKKMKMR
jgi:hypothetical protein